MQTHSFEYDDFQKRAIAVIDQERSLLVSAPTGSGKTVIAEYAIEQSLARNEGVIYTAPIKALSNQKYRDFASKYGDKIGILTGDVSINPDAPVLIMTTEIYRNTLFEDTKRLQNIRWVIFDEVHYLDDWERGTVWEESIMFSPPHLELLCLSATVPNVSEIADWIREILKRPIEVILESHRPVPLVQLFQCQGKIVNNIEKLRREGYEGHDNWSELRRQRRHRHHWDEHRALPNRLDKLIAHLQSENRLPAIFFTFGRRRTETLAWELPTFDFLNEEERKEIVNLYTELCEKFGLLSEKSAQDLKPLIDRGIAYHHAGMLPTLKEVIERLFTSKLIKLIFTTETFALGINMPARTVVFDELRKFYGTHFGNLKTRDFYQMAGRAGRRGMDERGFVYSRVNPHQTPHHDVVKIIHGKPEAIQSQFNTTYATLLNLHKEFGERLLDVYPKSLHHYQNSNKGREKGVGLMERKCDLLREMNYMSGNGLTSKGEFASCLYGYELLLSEMHERGFLDGFDPVALNVLLISLIYEARKNDEAPDIPKRFRKMAQDVVGFLFEIRRIEKRFGVRPVTRDPSFHLSNEMEKWSRGMSFEELMMKSKVDEGELIRYFRMVIQLLKELRSAPHASSRLQETTHEAIRLINRDIVDAEKQLRA